MFALVEEAEARKARFYIHKYEVSLAYGGSEEGGWWYDTGTPADDNPLPIASFTDEETAFERCRALNEAEHIRAEKEERYSYTSVLSYRSTHYAYDVSEEPYARPYPSHRPHYE